MYCPSCGKEIPENSSFCLHCGTSLAVSIDVAAKDEQERGKFLSESAISKWSNLLGGLEGWSPFFTPSPKELELLSKLDPPLDVGKEEFVFCSPITARIMIPPPPASISVGWAKIRGQTITVASDLFQFKWGYLLGTSSRLVAYNSKAKKAEQIFYGEIVSLDIDRDHFVLHLKDGDTADLHMRISRPGLLAAAAVMGAPTPLEKELILSREKARAGDAESFVRLFSQFFAEIIDRNRRS